MIKNIIIGVLLFSVIAITFWSKQRSSDDKRLTNGDTVDRTFDARISVADSSLKGYLVFGASSIDHRSGELLIMNMMGKVVYRQRAPQGVFDYRPWILGNKLYYTYAQCDTNTYSIKCLHPVIPSAHFVLLDSAMNKVRDIKLLPHDDVNLDRNDGLDAHDIIMLSPDHYITYAGYVKWVSNIPASLNPPKRKKVVACIVQEVQDGKVIWQWDATQFPELYLASKDDNEFQDTLATHYAHANSIAIDPHDSNLVISFRNLNQFVKVDRKSGSILWHCGGVNSDFPISSEQRFYWQHAVKFMADGKTIQFVDNGYRTARPYTRIVELQLDEAKKQIASYKAYKVPHLYVPRRGNVTTLGDKYLICGGEAGYMLLVDPKTDRYFFEMQGDQSFYRGYYIENIRGLEKQGKVAHSK